MAKSTLIQEDLKTNLKKENKVNIKNNKIKGLKIIKKLLNIKQILVKN